MGALVLCLSYGLLGAHLFVLIPWPVQGLCVTLHGSCST